MRNFVESGECGRGGEKEEFAEILHPINDRFEYKPAIPRRWVTGFSVAVSDIVHRSNIEDHAGVGNGCNTPDNGQSWIRSGLKERFSGLFRRCPGCNSVDIG